MKSEPLKIFPAEKFHYFNHTPIIKPNYKKSGTATKNHRTFPGILEFVGPLTPFLPFHISK